MVEEAPGAAPPLRFEILGRLRGWRGDDELDLGPGKQRAVLAVLLLNANKPTPTTKIIDAVWQDTPPENGANVVQKYVAGLRRILEPGRSPRTPGQKLTLTDAGYILHIGPDCLDAEVFGRRVRQAQATRSQGKPADAVDQLRAALALWREQALAGLHGPLFETARDRLAEDRAAALETCAEIELELGRHGRLISELVRLVADFPLREQLRYLLILALYRCGRQAEALAAFQEARHFLNEEFGVEPGERLQQLHLSILRSDPALATTSGDTTPPDPSPNPATAPPAETPSSSSPPTPPPSAAPLAAWAQVSPVLPSIGEASGLEQPQVPLVTAHPPTAHPPAAHPPTARSDHTHRRPWLPRLFAMLFFVSIPLFSFGFLSWAVIAYFAGRRRSRPLALAAAGYFALTAVFVLAIESASGSVMENIAMLALVLALVGGVVHTALLVPGPDHVSTAPPAAPDTVETLARRVRREQALTLIDHYPAIARELRVGRPDLPRLFNDGGLIDVNAVPAHVLSALPGITAHQAQRIVTDRQVHGGFTSVEDLIARGLLPASVAHTLRETLIAIR